MESYTIKQLKDVIVKYNLKTKIAGYSKQNKDNLIANIKKHLDHNNGTFTAKVIQPIIIKSNFDTTPIKIEQIKEEPKLTGVKLDEQLLKNVIDKVKIYNKDGVRINIQPKEYINEIKNTNDYAMEQFKKYTAERDTKRDMSFYSLTDKIKRFVRNETGETAKEKKEYENEFRNQMNKLTQLSQKEDMYDRIKYNIDEMKTSKNLKDELKKYLKNKDYKFKLI